MLPSARAPRKGRLKPAPAMTSCGRWWLPSRRPRSCVELRSRALDGARAQLAKLEAEAAKVAEQKQRDETAAEIERRALELEAAGQAFDGAMARLAAAAQQAIEVTFDANGIHVFASNARLEMPPAITMTAQVMRDRARATVAGNAPAIIATAPPVLLAPPKSAAVPTASVFLLRPVK